MKIKMAGCILLALAAVMAAGCQSSTQGYSGQSASGQSVAEEKVGIPMAEHNRENQCPAVYHLMGSV